MPRGHQLGREGATDIYHLNDRFCQIIGLSYDEARSYENLLKAPIPTTARTRRNSWHGCGGRDGQLHPEKRYVHKDGRIVWAAHGGSAARRVRRIIQHFAMLVDITDRVRAEQEARASELRLRRYFENASEILYSVDAQGVFTFVSPAWTLKLGMRWAMLSGIRSPSSCTRRHARVRGLLPRGGRVGVSSHSVEYRIRHSDGTWRWHASTGSVIRDEKGAPVFFGIGRDVTRRHKAQAELRAALERREELERIIARSPSVAVLWSAQEGWSVQFVSESISQFGYSAQELVSGRVRYLDLIHPEDVARVMDEVRAHTLSGHAEYRQEYRIVRRDGQVRWIDDRTAVRFDAEGRATHHEGILTDVTDRKEAEERERIGRERDLRIAHEVQQHLLPNVYPDIGAVEIDTLYTRRAWSVATTTTSSRWASGAGVSRWPMCRARALRRR
jgi:PAS domain S-box-containing protein